MNTAIAIPFRDRGRDPLRKANLDAVLEYWGNQVHVVGDGRDGDRQFNRSAAYNRAVATIDADMFVFTESDMLLPFTQIDAAIELAAASPGLVVPFTQYRYLSPGDSESVRAGDMDPFDATPETTMEDGKSIGAVNVVSRTTLTAVGGYDERFEGNWYDDTAMRIAFDICAGPTRWVDGPAVHLYHLPGWTGEHLTAEDRAATARNKARYQLYKTARTPEQIRQLTTGVR